MHAKFQLQKKKVLGAKKKKKNEIFQNQQLFHFQKIQLWMSTYAVIFLKK